MGPLKCDHFPFPCLCLVPTSALQNSDAMRKKDRHPFVGWFTLKEIRTLPPKMVDKQKRSNHPPPKKTDKSQQRGSNPRVATVKKLPPKHLGHAAREIPPGRTRSEPVRQSASAQRWPPRDLHDAAVGSTELGQLSTWLWLKKGVPELHLGQWTEDEPPAQPQLFHFEPHPRCPEMGGKMRSGSVQPEEPGGIPCSN